MKFGVYAIISFGVMVKTDAYLNTDKDIHREREKNRILCRNKDKN